MDYRQLGNTSIRMSVLGFGCASVWGKNLISDQQAQELMERAYSLGINYFDTGYSYGNAEERIGKILQTSSIIKRDHIIISTKFGTKNVKGKYVHDFSPEWVKQSVDVSLKRMGLDYVDMIMCHGPQVADLTDEYLSEIHKLKENGITRAVGINTFDTDIIEYVRDTKCVDFVMLDYNILRQDREPLIEQLHEKGIGVIAGAALAESLYSNRIFRIRKTKDLWYLARAFARFRGQVVKGRRFTFINDVPGMTGNQIALNYDISNTNISSAVFGTTTPAHLEDNVKAVGVTIPDNILQRIKRTK